MALVVCNSLTDCRRNKQWKFKFRAIIASSHSLQFPSRKKNYRVYSVKCSLCFWFPKTFWSGKTQELSIIFHHIYGYWFRLQHFFIATCVCMHTSRYIFHIWYFLKDRAYVYSAFLSNRSIHFLNSIPRLSWTLLVVLKKKGLLHIWLLWDVVTRTSLAEVLTSHVNRQKKWIEENRQILSCIL